MEDVLGLLLFIRDAVIVGAGLYVLSLITWLFYVALMHLKRYRDRLHPFAKFNAYILIAIGLPLDVLVNWIVGTILFLEIPREILFTTRLSRHKKGRGRKQRLAVWLCSHLLDPFDNGNHC